MTDQMLATIAPRTVTFSNPMVAVPAAPTLFANLPDTPENRAAVAAACKEIDLTKPDSLILWGAAAQQRLGEVSRQLIDNTKTKDAGPVGAALTGLVLKVKGFDISDLNAAEKKVGFLERLWKKGTLPLNIAVQRFNTVENQINEIVRGLDRHVGVMMRDIVMLERIYDENVKAYQSILIYIEAGRQMLARIDDVELPALRAALTPNDPLSSERVERMTKFRQRLERRVNDFVLTRTALFQGLPAVALIEDNDANMVERIQSTIANAVPLWYQRIAVLIAARNGLSAAKTESVANDFTNEMLVESAKQLRISNTAIRTEVERGIFDADKLKLANDEVVGALNDCLRIYEEGAKRRKKDLAIADQCEADMRRAMEGIKAAHV